MNETQETWAAAQPALNSAESSESIFLILGTAGHIDHGKTTLIKILSGKDTDRLPEEKKRGITIELGFAHLSCSPYEFGIVDVPGHQKFVKTMLAGSTGVDVVLLVVAADDSVNQQTREHLDILRFLDVPAGVIAITKCDRVEPSWLELVEEEIRELVRGTFLEDASMVQTSAITGAGIPELKTALVRAAAVASQDRQRLVEEPFRMPIDRVFSIDGYGTIVTGSVTHGRVEVGQTLQVLPDFPDREIRVRSLQTHDQAVQQVVRGQRAAINLVGVSVDDVRRGFQLSAPGAQPISQCLTVELTASEIFADGVADHQEIRVHLATTEVLGKVRFLQVREHQDVPASETVKQLPAGQTILAQLHLKQPVPAVWGQRLVLRRPSPATTMAAAVVLDPGLPKQTRLTEQDLQILRQLKSPDPRHRLSAMAYFRVDGQLPTGEVASRLAIDPAIRQSLLTDLDETLVSFSAGSHSFLFHRQRLERLQQSIVDFLDKQHLQQPKRWFIDRQQLDSHLHFVPATVLQALLKELEKSKRLRISTMGVGLADRGPVLTKNQQKLLEQLLQEFRSARFIPPTPQQCIDNAAKNKQDVLELLRMASESGDLIPIESDVYLSSDVFAEAWQTIKCELGNDHGLTVAQIRDLLGITRKLAIPFCEYLDRQGFTKRQGDLRFLSAPPAAIAPA